MNTQPQNFSSPLTIIAIFAAIIEASALASLPFLEEDSQAIYTWFLVGFPPFLTLLFFITLNFNYKALYSPSDYHNGQDFLTAMTPSPVPIQVPTENMLPQPEAALMVIASSHYRHTVETALINVMASLAVDKKFSYNIMAWNSETLKMDNVAQKTSD